MSGPVMITRRIAAALSVKIRTEQLRGARSMVDGRVR
jgi:hypothetical protein